MSDKQTTANKIAAGLRDALALSAVAHCVQAWHCNQAQVPAPCGPDCSCWQSAQPIIDAYRGAMQDR